MKRYTKEELEKLILVEGKSYLAIGRIYGVTGTAIKRAAQRFGIDLSPRRKVNTNEIFSRKEAGPKSLVLRINDEDFINIIKESKTWWKIGNRLGYTCKISRKVKEQVLERASKLGMEVHIDECSLVSDCTKGEMLAKNGGWFYMRSKISQNARRTFLEKNPNPKCKICGYNKHIEVAHIIPVSSFGKNSKISEINSIDNLIALCPNHHWEYDNGILKI